MKHLDNNSTNPPQYSISLILKKLLDDYRNYRNEADHTLEMMTAPPAYPKPEIEAEQAINQLIYTQVLELIGQPEPEIEGNTHLNGAIVRNKLKDELRAKAKERFDG